MLKHLGHQRLAFLDQIRALAVLLVVLCHFRGDLFPGGGVGVGVFFSLSGYLIASILFETMPLDFRAVLAFIVRRFMRVYPAYLIVIMAVVGMTALKNPAAVPAMAGALPGLLTFLWEPSWEGYSFGILWTLQVEMAFYLLVPVAMWLLGHVQGALAVSAILLLYGTGLPHLPLAGTALTVWGAALALGMLLAVLSRRTWPPIPAPAVWASIATALAGLAVLCGMAATQKLWHSEVMAGSVCGCLLIGAFIARPSLPVLPFGAWIGRISYSLYLWHAPEIDFRLYFNPIFDLFLHSDWTYPLAWMGGYFITLVGIGAASYYLIEKPGIRLGRRLAEIISPPGPKPITAASRPVIERPRSA
jgi:peptidoglycan/LPS O-acetylase OafA/YrhL